MDDAKAVQRPQRAAHVPGHPDGLIRGQGPAALQQAGQAVPRYEFFQHQDPAAALRRLQHMGQVGAVHPQQLLVDRCASGKGALDGQRAVWTWRRRRICFAGVSFRVRTGVNRAWMLCCKKSKNKMFLLTKQTAYCYFRVIWIIV